MMDVKDTLPFQKTIEFSEAELKKSYTTCSDAFKASKFLPVTYRIRYCNGWKNVVKMELDAMKYLVPTIIKKDDDDSEKEMPQKSPTSIICECTMTINGVKRELLTELYREKHIVQETFEVTDKDIVNGKLTINVKGKVSITRTDLDDVHCVNVTMYNAPFDLKWRNIERSTFEKTFVYSDDHLKEAVATNRSFQCKSQPIPGYPDFKFILEFQPTGLIVARIGKLFSESLEVICNGTLTLMSTNESQPIKSLRKGKKHRVIKAFQFNPGDLFRPSSKMIVNGKLAVHLKVTITVGFKISRQPKKESQCQNLPSEDLFLLTSKLPLPSLVEKCCRYLTSLWTRDEDKDYTLKLDNGKGFKIHRDIISLHSLNICLYSSFYVCNNEDEDVIPYAIEYCYNHQIWISVSNAMKLWKLANRMFMPVLKKDIVDFLIKNMTPSNVSEITNFAHQNDCYELRLHCSKYFYNEFVKASSNWKNLESKSKSELLAFFGYKLEF